MKLISSLSKLILEQSRKWDDIVLTSNDYDDISSVVKMFSGLDNLFFALEKRGKGEEFLDRVVNFWDDPEALMYVLGLLGGVRAYQNGSIDTDLLDKYIIEPFVDGIGYLNYAEDGRLVLEIVDSEKPGLFYDGHDNCRSIAEGIFSDEGLEWEPYDISYDLEDLLNMLTEENYIRLVRHIGIEFENKIVTSFREEFNSWKEEDGLGKDEFYITLGRMNSFLGGDDRYNLAVLIGNTDELSDIGWDIKNSYSNAWNSVVESQYYTAYNKAVEELLGEPIGVGVLHLYRTVDGKHTKSDIPSEKYDVTDLAKRAIVTEVSDYGMQENGDLIDMLRDQDMADLCPNVEDWPEDDDEVEELFNENLFNYL